MHKLLLALVMILPCFAQTTVIYDPLSRKLIANIPLGTAGSGTVTSAIIAGTSNKIAVSGTCTITTTGTCTITIPDGVVLVTPDLGTPSALVLTNATGLPAAQVPVVNFVTGTSLTMTAPRTYGICTGTCTVTVPVPAAGYEFCVLNGDNVSTAITLSALGSSARYENSARTAYGTAGTGTLVVSAAAANKVCILGLDSTHYLTVTYNGTVTVN